jgi:hypothetical protein
MRIVLLSVLLTISAVPQIIAQTAKVIQLSPEDAAKAKDLYAQKADIEKKIADLQAKIAGGYTTEKKEQQYLNCCCCGIKESDGKTYVTQFKDGWGGGFEYSSDFKFIVPKMPPAYSVSPYQYWPACGGINLSGSGITTTN